jgi:hypothetical protein
MLTLRWGLLSAAGIEEIGVQIEEPFSILALENLVGVTPSHIVLG